jgi:hypothetical protein
LRTRPPLKTAVLFCYGDIHVAQDLDVTRLREEIWDREVRNWKEWRGVHRIAGFWLLLGFD